MNHKAPMDNLSAMGTLAVFSVIALCALIRLVWLLTVPFSRLEGWLDRLPDRIADPLMKPAIKQARTACGEQSWRLTDDGWEEI